MNYKLSDTDKIEVEAGHLRKIAELFDGRYIQAALDVRTTYPAAFEEAPEEWEDVTDRLILLGPREGVGPMLRSPLVMFDLSQWKIENNRIWRRK